MRDAKLNKQLSRMQEQSEARRMTSANSGASWNKKGDIQSSQKFVECKITSAKQFILKCETILKLQAQALETDKEPVLKITFYDQKRGSVNLWCYLEPKDK